MIKREETFKYVNLLPVVSKRLGITSAILRASYDLYTQSMFTDGISLTKEQQEKIAEIHHLSESLHASFVSAQANMLKDVNYHIQREKLDTGFQG